jgi:hypothetical protein
MRSVLLGDAQRAWQLEPRRELLQSRGVSHCKRKPESVDTRADERRRRKWLGASLA